MIETIAFVLTGIGLAASVIYYANILSNANAARARVFTKGTIKRDVAFRGLAVPGSEIHEQDEDLIAIWKDRDGARAYDLYFQSIKLTC